MTFKTSLSLLKVMIKMKSHGSMSLALAKNLLETIKLSLRLELLVSENKMEAAVSSKS